MVSNDYSISAGGIVCDYFLEAVLPLDKELSRAVWAEIGKPAPALYDGAEDAEPAQAKPVRQCASCGKPFIPSGSRSTYCKGCREEVKRKQAARRMREYRAR